MHYLTRLAATAAQRQALPEALAALEAAELHAGKLPPDARESLIVDLGFRQGLCLAQLGRLSQSLDVLRAQRERIERLGDPGLEARYWFWLGYVSCVYGQSDPGVAHLDRAIEQASRCGDAVIEGMARCRLGLEAGWAGRFDEGLEQSRRAIALLERAAQSGWLVSAHLHIGVNWYHVGRFDLALEAAGHGAKLAADVHDMHLQSYAAWIAALALGARGDWPEGIDAGERAVAAAGNPVDRALAGAALGYVHVRRRDPGPAIAALAPSVEALKRFGFAQFHGIYAIVLGEAHLLAGDAARAEALAREGLDVTRGAGYAFGVGFSQRLLGRLGSAAGDHPQALDGLESALQTFTGIGARFEAARTRLELATLVESRDDRKAAAVHAREALDAFVALGTPVYAARVRIMLERLAGA